MPEVIKPEEEIKVFCRRCGRILKEEHSKEIGFGPNCYRQWKKERSQQIKLFDIKKGDENERGE